MSVEFVRAAIDAAIMLQTNETCSIVTVEEANQILTEVGGKMGSNEYAELALWLQASQTRGTLFDPEAYEKLSGATRSHLESFSKSAERWLLILGFPLAVLMAAPPIAGLLLFETPGFVAGVVLDLAGIGLAYYLWDRADKAADAE